MPEPADYSSHFADRLRELGIEPVLIGALAANEYRQVARLTTDVDFLARSLTGVAEAMEADGFEVRTMAEPGGLPYLLFIRGSGIRVDVIAAQTEYQIGALERAVDGVLTVEDVIIHKLIAWRSKDQADIEQILAADPELDVAYLELWADEWGVEDRWEEARRMFG